MVLGISGLIMLFGKFVLMPVFGHTLFAWLTSLCKNLHNFVAPLFIASLPVFILIFIRDNLPEKGDLKWLLNAYKMFLGQHMPSGKYNAGEKAWFWGGVVFLSITLCISGAVLLFPNFEQLRATMQQAHVVHAIAGVLVICICSGICTWAASAWKVPIATCVTATDETWARSITRTGTTTSSPAGAGDAAAAALGRRKQV